ncbi:hypothetical protein [Kitasatospora griseola]|uniref:hypothetical protein n=1 Tax=Kitasatospora griseola TaxID=2064 RepID=UPI0038167E81
MSDALVRFVYATMRKRLNNLENTHNLPKLLKQVKLGDGSYLLPVKADDWRLGTVGGGAGDTIATATANGWWSLISAKYAGKADPKFTVTDFSAIPLPSSPCPSLTLPSAEISGLDNVQLGELGSLETLDDGYRLTVPFLFGLHAGLPQTITVDGRYQLQQSVCARKGTEKKPTGFATTMPCVLWPIDQVSGTGTFSLIVSGLVVHITLRIQVTGAGTGRRIRLSVEAVRAEGDGGQECPIFTLVPDKLTVDDPTDPNCVKSEALKKVWICNAVMVFDCQQARTALTQQLDATLNLEDSLAQFGAAVTELLDHVLDAALGTVQQGELAGGVPPGNNPVDQYLFDRLRTSVGKAKSPFYPPSVLLSAKRPTIEPYWIEEMEVGDIDLGDWGTAEDVRFVKATVTGTSNAVVPPEKAVLDRGTVRATVALSALRGRPPVPDPPLKLTGTFCFTYQGSQSPDGGLTVTVDASSLTAALSFSGADVDSLGITFGALTAGFENKDLDITVDLKGGEFEGIVNEALKGDSIKNDVRVALNNALAKDLGSIGEGVSSVVRKAITDLLDKPDEQAPSEPAEATTVPPR